MSFPAGTPTTVPITVTALDADGNIIISPGDYVDSNGSPIPFSIHYSGDSTSPTVVGSPIAAPGQGQTLSYDGYPTFGGSISTKIQTSSGTAIVSNNVSVNVTPTIVSTSTYPPGIDPNCITFASGIPVFSAAYAPGNGIFPYFGAIVAGGVVHLFPIPTPSGTTAAALCAVLGPDGRVWTSLGNAAAAIDTSAQITVYPFATPTVNPNPSPSATLPPNLFGFGQPVVTPSGLALMQTPIYNSLGLTYLSTSGQIGQFISLEPGAPDTFNSVHTAIVSPANVIFTYANDPQSGAPQLVTGNLSGPISIVPLPFGPTDIAGENYKSFSAFGVGETATVYRLSATGVTPVPMPTVGLYEQLTSLASGTANDVWVGGSNTSNALLGHINADANTGQLYPLSLNNCGITMLAFDPSTKVIYAGTVAAPPCNMFEKIIY